MSDLPLLRFARLARDARIDMPAETVGDWQMLKRCLHCDTQTWPIARDENGKRRQQCLCCGQRYMLGK